MSEILLTIGALAAVGQVGATLPVALSEDPGPWPPTEFGGQFGLYWLAVMEMAGSFFALLATTHGSLYAVTPVTVAVGGLIGVGGAAVNVWTADPFDDSEEILGLQLSFHTEGPGSCGARPSSTTPGPWTGSRSSRLMISTPPRCGYRLVVRPQAVCRRARPPTCVCVAVPPLPRSRRPIRRCRSTPKRRLGLCLLPARQLLTCYYWRPVASRP
mgnify:CR=1 FL=1